MPRPDPRSVPDSVRDTFASYDMVMTNWAEKTWRAPQMGAKALTLLPTYQQYPNRTLQRAGISGAVFDLDDAQVQQQVQKMLHALTANT